MTANPFLDMTKIIIIAVVAGVAVIGLVLILVICLIKRRQAKDKLGEYEVKHEINSPELFEKTYKIEDSDMKKAKVGDNIVVSDMDASTKNKKMKTQKSLTVPV